MFRAKIAALYFLLTLFAVAVVHYAVREGAGQVEQEVGSRVAHAFEGFERMRQLQQLSMHNAAFQLANSELAVYLRTLEDFRQDLVDLERELYSRWPRAAEPRHELEAAAQRAAHVEQTAGFVPRFASLLADRLGKAPSPPGEVGDREDFVQRTAVDLRACAAVGMNKCFYRFTHGPLGEVLQRELPRLSGAFRPDVVVVTDRRGAGWAHSHNAHWSDQQRFAERVPVVREIPSRGVVDDLVRLSPDDDYHFLTGMGLYEGDRYVGAVLVGVRVDDELVRALAQTISLEVSLFVGDKAIATSAGPRGQEVVEFAQRVLSHLPPEDRYQRAELRGDGDFSGVGFYYHRPERRSAERERAAFVPREIEALQVVLSVDQAAALSGFRQVEALLPLFAAFLFGLGVLLFLVLVRQFTRPFEAIDHGIQQVLGGNLDWQFRAEGDDELPRAMAENLNLLVTSLTGREVDPEDVESEAWAHRLLSDDSLERDTEPVDPGADEPAELYQRRLYREFLDARDAVLGAGEPMTFEAFVRLLDENEADIRARYACERVRFHVAVQNEQVVLSPEVVG